MILYALLWNPEASLPCQAHWAASGNPEELSSLHTDSAQFTNITRSAAGRSRGLGFIAVAALETCLDSRFWTVLAHVSGLLRCPGYVCAWSGKISSTSTSEQLDLGEDFLVKGIFEKVILDSRIYVIDYHQTPMRQTSYCILYAYEANSPNTCSSRCWGWILQEPTSTASRNGRFLGAMWARASLPHRMLLRQLMPCFSGCDLK